MNQLKIAFPIEIGSRSKGSFQKNQGTGTKTGGTVLPVNLDVTVLWLGFTYSYADLGPHPAPRSPTE